MSSAAASSEARVRWLVRAVLYGALLGLVAVAWHMRQANGRDPASPRASWTTPRPVTRHMSPLQRATAQDDWRNSWWEVPISPRRIRAGELAVEVGFFHGRLGFFSAPISVDCHGPLRAEANWGMQGTPPLEQHGGVATGEEMIQLSFPNGGSAGTAIAHVRVTIDAHPAATLRID